MQRRRRPYKILREFDFDFQAPAFFIASRLRKRLLVLGGRNDHNFHVHLSHLRLRDFRNYGRLDVDFTPGVQILIGDNAQGKTNVLEAIYLLATLRSFRGVGGTQMIRQGEKAYFIGASLVGESEQNIKIYWSANERRLALNGEPVRKLTDYFGTVRVVVFCTEDMQLIKGTARFRRRFLDLLLAQTHAAYLPLLQRYTRAVRNRNHLLKQPHLEKDLLASFTREVVQAGNQIMDLRGKLIPKISPLARLAYRRIASDLEELRLEYQPSVKQDFEMELARNRERELTYKTTVIGPHRDELKLLIDDRSAAQYASEGQKRSLAIALKMAQAEYLSGLYGAPPILLIDDVMGELDARRRGAFRPLLAKSSSGRGQVFITCTEDHWPEEGGASWHRWLVKNGEIRKKQAAS